MFLRVLLLVVLPTSTFAADKPSRKERRGDGIRSSYTYKTVAQNKLDLFVDTPKEHEAGAKVPAIVFFHGGGFQTGSVNQFRTQAKYLAERGMVAVRVRYRLTRDTGVEVTDCIEDAISAMRWVRANAGKLGVDPDRIAAGGRLRRRLPLDRHLDGRFHQRKNRPG